MPRRIVEEPTLDPVPVGLGRNLGSAGQARRRWGAPEPVIDRSLDTGRAGLTGASVSGWAGTRPGCGSGWGYRPRRCCESPRLLLLDEPTSRPRSGRLAGRRHPHARARRAGRGRAAVQSPDRGAREGLRRLHGHPRRPCRVGRHRDRVGGPGAGLRLRPDHQRRRSGAGDRGGDVGDPRRPVAPGQLAIAIQEGDLDGRLFLVRRPRRGASAGAPAQPAGEYVLRAQRRREG